MTEPQPLFSSHLPFEGARIGAAAVYCSDGRFGEQCDDFLYSGLGLPRYDRLAVPGGAACLAGHFAAYRDGDTLASQLEFLVLVHALRRVILIAHEGCAFYTERLRITPIDLVTRQHKDLFKAAERVRGLHRELVVEAYFARLDDDHVSFELIV